MDSAKRKVVIVTGASGGIGRAIARAFAENGYQTVIHYNQAEREARLLEAELKTGGCDVVCLQADLCRREQAELLFEQAVDYFGALTTLVNNAAISRISMLCDVSEDEWFEIMNTDLFSVYRCSQIAVRHLVPAGGGQIINIASMWGQVGASCEVAYSTAKAGVIGFTKALAREVGPANIRVNCLAPGLIDTGMNEAVAAEAIEAIVADTALQRIGLPEDVAKAALFLASDDAAYITGQTLGVNGGYVI